MTEFTSILNAKSSVALFISLQDLGRNKYTNSCMNLTVSLLNWLFLQLKTIFALAINVNDGKYKKHVHDVYLVQDKSVLIVVCSFVIDSVQLTEKR